MKWPNSIRKYTTPPIKKPDGSLARSNKDKQAVLKQVLLTPTVYGAFDSDIRLANLSEDSRDVAMEWNTCTYQEVEEAVMHAGNTSPGVDETPPLIIKRAWPILGNEITLLFQLCIEEGYHPAVFKTAILCALPKPGNRPKHLPRFYRLIALLSCLGKVLERIVARRLGDIALLSCLVSPLHFGTIPGRSAVDAACTLTHDIERAWGKKDILTGLAFDIKGAFDTVTEERLIQRLWEQRIPLPIIRWVASFLTNRKAAIRLDGYTGIQEKIQIGVPQGSPVAPILFMLFTAPLFRLFSGDKKEPGIAIRGYVDDVLLTSRGTSEQICTTKIVAAFEKVEKWAYENGLIFDPAKFEAIHFSRKRDTTNPPINLPPPPFLSDPETTRVVQPVSKTSSMRWLGVYFDTGLSFKNHVEKMASKGRKAVAGLNMLGNTTKGMDVKVIRRAVHACILRILTYAAPTWWAGRTRINNAGKTIRNGVEGQLKRLDKVQNIALRTILPVWRTTPIRIMQREAATSPIEYTLDHLCELASLRLHKLEPRHPLRLRTKKAYQSLRSTRLEKLAQLCPAGTQYSNPLLDSCP